mgnify:CR=1 FL=1
MAKEANFVFLAIFSVSGLASLPCSRALFLQSQSQAVPEEGASGTEFPFGTPVSFPEKS